MITTHCPFNQILWKLKNQHAGCSRNSAHISFHNSCECGSCARVFSRSGSSAQSAQLITHRCLNQSGAGLHPPDGGGWSEHRFAHSVTCLLKTQSVVDVFLNCVTVNHQVFIMSLVKTNTGLLVASLPTGDCVMFFFPLSVFQWGSNSTFWSKSPPVQLALTLYLFIYI